jgi:hypothetical protein
MFAGNKGVVRIVLLSSSNMRRKIGADLYLFAHGCIEAARTRLTSFDVGWAKHDRPQPRRAGFGEVSSSIVKQQGPQSFHPRRTGKTTSAAS